MDVIILIISVSLFTWFLTYDQFYGAKAQIKWLWKEIHGYSSRMSKFSDMGKSNFPLHGKIVYDLESMQDRAGKLINAILDYEYPDLQEQEPEIQEYVSENRYEIKHK